MYMNTYPISTPSQLTKFQNKSSYYNYIPVCVSCNTLWDFENNTY